MLFEVLRKMEFGGGNSDSIAKRLTYAFIIFGIVATLLITAIQIYRDYHKEISILHSQVEDVEETHGLSLSASLWSFSGKQIELELQGILKNSSFKYAEVDSVDGETWAVGNKPSTDTIINEIPLVYLEDKKEQILGSLFVVASKQSIYSRIKSRAFETLLYFALLVSLMAVTQFLIVRQLITRHLKTLAEYTSSISFDEKALSSLLALDRRTSKKIEKDELSQVVTSINSMQTQLISSIDELQKLSRAVESSSSAIFITNLEGLIEYINPKFTEITGYTKEDTEDQFSTILKSGVTPREVYDDLWQTLHSGGDWKGELYNRKKDGSCYWARTSIASIKNSNGVITHYVAIQEDVTHEYELSEKLSYQASHDALTGLINRREFERRAEHLLATVKHDESMHVLCYLDLDQFKVVNDTCGHSAGDRMLQQLSSILKETVRQHDTLARLGGDDLVY